MATPDMMWPGPRDESEHTSADMERDQLDTDILKFEIKNRPIIWDVKSQEYKASIINKVFGRNCGYFLYLILRLTFPLFSI